MILGPIALLCIGGVIDFINLATQTGLAFYAILVESIAWAWLSASIYIYLPDLWGYGIPAIVISIIMEIPANYWLTGIMWPVWAIPHLFLLMAMFLWMYTLPRLVGGVRHAE